MLAWCCAEVLSKLRLIHYFPDYPPTPISNLSMLVNLVYLPMRLDFYDHSPAVTDGIIEALECMPQLRVLVVEEVEQGSRRVDTQFVLPHPAQASLHEV